MVDLVSRRYPVRLIADPLWNAITVKIHRNGSVPFKIHYLPGICILMVDQQPILRTDGAEGNFNSSTGYFPGYEVQRVYPHLIPVRGG